MTIVVQHACLYVTEFAKKGLTHASNFSTLEVCYLPHV